MLAILYFLAVFLIKGGLLYGYPPYVIVGVLYIIAFINIIYGIVKTINAEYWLFDKNKGTVTVTVFSKHLFIRTYKEYQLEDITDVEIVSKRNDLAALNKGHKPFLYCIYYDCFLCLKLKSGKIKSKNATWPCAKLEKDVKRLRDFLGLTVTHKSVLPEESYLCHVFIFMIGQIITLLVLFLVSILFMKTVSEVSETDLYVVGGLALILLFFGVCCVLIALPKAIIWTLRR